MKAKRVYENIDFQRGRDPKSSMGIGIDPKNQEQFIPFIIDRMPEILGVNRIPIDILGTRNQYLNPSYYTKVELGVRNILDQKLPGEPIDIGGIPKLGYEFWGELVNALRAAGFKHRYQPDNKSFESLEFERGKDPKRSLKVGRYASVWGEITDELDKEIKIQDTRRPYKWKESTDYDIIVSDRMRSILICFYNRPEGYVSHLFQILNSGNFFNIVNRIIKQTSGEESYISVNFANNLDLSKYTIPPGKTPTGFFELLIL
jgi:hypothetical protein